MYYVEHIHFYVDILVFYLYLGLILEWLSYCSTQLFILLLFIYDIIEFIVS